MAIVLPRSWLIQRPPPELTTFKMPTAMKTILGVFAKPPVRGEFSSTKNGSVFGR
ncbi:hypothetical protein GWI33_012618, partial [Rhynchophorus ferrugineus]